MMRHSAPLACGSPRLHFLAPSARSCGSVDSHPPRSAHRSAATEVCGGGPRPHAPGPQPSPGRTWRRAASGGAPTRSSRHFHSRLGPPKSLATLSTLEAAFELVLDPLQHWAERVEVCWRIPASSFRKAETADGQGVQTHAGATRDAQATRRGALHRLTLRVRRRTREHDPPGDPKARRQLDTERNCDRHSVQTLPAPRRAALAVCRRTSYGLTAASAERRADFAPRRSRPCGGAGKMHRAAQASGS